MHIVFDIGGTNMRVAGVRDGALVSITKEPTPEEFDATIERCARLARTIAGEEVIEVVAGCIPAQVGEEGIYDANNRPSWNGRHFDRELAGVLGTSVRIGNDCAVIALGELEYGAGRGAKHLAYVTVSTGVGAGQVIDGRIVPDDGFFLGHVEVRGVELEDQISGTAVRARYHVEPKELASIEEREKLADIFAEGLVPLIDRWKPDTIVVGGSMIVGLNPIPLQRVENALTSLRAEMQVPHLYRASLGDTGGLYGGLVLASQNGVQ